MKEWFLIVLGTSFLILMGVEGVSSINGHAKSKRAEDTEKAVKICEFQAGRFVYRNKNNDILYKDKVILTSTNAKKKEYCQ